MRREHWRPCDGLLGNVVRGIEATNGQATTPGRQAHCENRRLHVRLVFEQVLQDGGASAGHPMLRRSQAHDAVRALGVEQLVLAVVAPHARMNWRVVVDGLPELDFVREPTPLDGASLRIGLLVETLPIIASVVATLAARQPPRRLGTTDVEGRVQVLAAMLATTARKADQAAPCVNNDGVSLRDWRTDQQVCEVVSILVDVAIYPRGLDAVVSNLHLTLHLGGRASELHPRGDEG
mmetsp:Transcript_174184/g.558561  ORF Transcript_174184/g.558561 Transcript_174184/m.558561 type:complete len:236 (+) Transcript_174184:975-1682(+)